MVQQALKPWFFDRQGESDDSAGALPNNVPTALRSQDSLRFTTLSGGLGAESDSGDSAES